MYRKQLDYLHDWKKRKNRKPLVIRGARQVGKTYLVREFGKESFKHYIELNFDEKPTLADLFDSDDLDVILRYLSIESQCEIIPGETLIFLDEIQRAPDIFAKLRYFFEKKPELHIIAAGSLLDFLLADHQFSMPVGRIEYMFMGPLDFAEFLLGTGEDHLYHFVKEFQLNDPVPQSIHNKLTDLVRLYTGVGGMPSALREYLDTGKLADAEREMSSILSTYRDDFSKYGTKTDPSLLQMVLDKAPALIGKKVKYSEISRDVKSAVLKQSIDFLAKARVLSPVFHSSGNAVPLRAGIKERDFKLLFLDTGLMMRSLGLNLIDIKNDKLLLANRGAVAEQYIGQQLISNLQASYEEPEIFYWNREKPGASSELDFLVQRGGLIVPVEVKSGKTGSLKSLQVFAAMKKSSLAVRFNLDVPSVLNSETSIPTMEAHKFTLVSLPLYLATELPRLIP